MYNLIKEMRENEKLFVKSQLKNSELNIKQSINKFDKYYWINLDNHTGLWIEEMFDDL